VHRVVSPVLALMGQVATTATGCAKNEVPEHPGGMRGNQSYRLLTCRPILTGAP